MNCPRCNYSFEGETCPICYTKVVPLNQQNAGNSQNMLLKICVNCNNQFVGTYCPLCGSNSTVKHQANVHKAPFNNNPPNGGKCLRCGGLINVQPCRHCGYTQPVSSGYVGGNGKINTYGNGYSNNQNQYDGYAYGYGFGYAQPMQKPKKSILLPVVMISFASILVLSTTVLAAFSLFDFSSTNQPVKPPIISGVNPPNEDNTVAVDYPDGVSLEEYKKLKIGMDYPQVSAIIGGDGQILSSEKGENKKTVYGWYGQNIQDASVIITFEDNKVVKIEQENLF